MAQSSHGRSPVSNHEGHMRCSWTAGFAVLVLGLLSAPARAQTTVEGGVVVRSGPVTGSVEVVTHPVREVIVVERRHLPHRRAHGWWKKRGYREITVYYDGRHYYRHRHKRGGRHAVIVYERGGRYYVFEKGHRKKERDHHRHEHDHDD